MSGGAKGPVRIEFSGSGRRSGIGKRMDGFDTGIFHQGLFPERPLDPRSDMDRKSRKQDGRSAHPYRFPFRITLLKKTNICHHDFHFEDMADKGWSTDLFSHAGPKWSALCLQRLQSSGVAHTSIVAPPFCPSVGWWRGACSIWPGWSEKTRMFAVPSSSKRPGGRRSYLPSPYSVPRTPCLQHFGKPAG